MALQEELVKSLSGDSVFSQDMIKAVIRRRERDQNNALQKLADAEQAVEDVRNQASIIYQQFDELLDWAKKYPSASIDAKRIILYHMIERVDVYRGYKLNITLTEQVQQFLSPLQIVF